jgi:DNA-binding Xre family transcriptional regulator
MAASPVQWQVARVEVSSMIRLRVKEVAKEKGIGQGKLQRMADMDIKTIRKMYRNPYTIITTETLDKLARALGVPPGELIEQVEDAQ